MRPSIAEVSWSTVRRARVSRAGRGRQAACCSSLRRGRPKVGSRARGCSTIASAPKPRGVSGQVAGSARQREEAVSRERETGVTRARRTTRPSRCSGLSSTGSDLDVADLLLGLLLGRWEHPHLLLERLELIVRLLSGNSALQLGQAAIEIRLAD